MALSSAHRVHNHRLSNGTGLSKHFRGYHNTQTMNVHQILEETNRTLSLLTAENILLKEKNETLTNLIKDYTLKYKEKEIQLTNEFSKRSQIFIPNRIIKRRNIRTCIQHNHTHSKFP